MADNLCSICGKVILIAVEVAACTNWCKHGAHNVLSRVMSELLKSIGTGLLPKSKTIFCLFAISQHRIDI